jgi:RNA polymerase sigma-70 factor (ECF subfamily)
MEQIPNPALTLDDLYQAFERKLKRYAVSLAHDSQKAEDLVQETFIRALAHLPLLGSLEKNQRLAWLRRVLKNRFIDEQRAYQREQKMVDHLIQETRTAHHDHISITSQELLDLVSDKERDLLFQRYILGMNSVEIGQRLGIPAATVRSRLHLAKKRLRPHRSDFR